jgi:hypothetical protein
MRRRIRLGTSAIGAGCISGNMVIASAAIVTHEGTERRKQERNTIWRIARKLSVLAEGARVIDQAQRLTAGSDQIGKGGGDSNGSR